ncbi:MAG: 50S ribosomal protein L24 [Candidatus Peregrinibacteria bacterium]
MRVKLNDNVVVIAGKDKGKKGHIIKILSEQKKVVIDKLNLRTKYVKKTAEKAGEKIQFSAPMDASNIMMICTNCQKPTRVGYKKLANGKKHRICKKCKENLDISKS